MVDVNIHGYIMCTYSKTENINSSVTLTELHYYLVH